MASTLGVSSAGTTFFSGTFSGIDTQALIENAVNAKLLPRKRLDDRVAVNVNKITAFQKLQTQSNALKAAFDKLKSDLVIPNTFQNKSATYASSNPAVTPASVLSVTAGATAQAGNYNIVVNTVAKNFIAEGTSQTSITTALGFAGSFDIGEDSLTASTITFDANDTIQSLAQKINATTTTSGVSADILQVAPGEFRLVVRGKDTNKAVNVTNISGDNILQNLGLTDAGGTFQNVTQPQSGASITINGTTVTNDSNIFTNVLTGLTINVASASPATTITVTVGNDNAAVKTAIQGIVDAYNALRTSIDEYTKVNADGSVPEGSFLYNDTAASNLKFVLSQTIVGTYGNSSVFNGLRSLGVSIDANNKLVLDGATIDNALKNNFNDVRAVFETNGSFTGIADTASALIDSYANVTTGSIQTLITNMQTLNVDLKRKSDDIKTQVEAFQLELISRYAKLEARMQQADTMKKQILAILEGSTPQR